MFKLQHIVNGFYPITVGTFDNIQDAVDVIKEHVRVNSAIINPRYAKSISSEAIRIDYGAKDCYYLITLIKQTEEKQNN
ncbi:TPA: hypothetical protein TVW26_001814 [Streptococcus equi subsp. equi]|uniref:hypothetical protein n=1 Tax=Streptococcus equi TaxID=1336 RepID=UPI001BDEF082|nr:hypothetical protein [Streptococcus equi]MBT1199244.1 hypothetical protein [Streptococcus equi subsp. equi]MBT1201081.1 hypothetical protein [Streptococcus equi subsp. equi]MBT1211489.1 hypothetical protein [Streptococcus equi subsp. equi]MCD3432189.1 hypothetical protein [Streptococcus equi subsp. zooepidemicus]MCD3432208.1 hypothetical protein [Streptococcus equi subsp. zooepidemicus]